MGLEAAIEQRGRDVKGASLLLRMLRCKLSCGSMRVVDGPGIGGWSGGGGGQ